MFKDFFERRNKLGRVLEYYITENMSYRHRLACAPYGNSLDEIPDYSTRNINLLSNPHEIEESFFTQVVEGAFFISTTIYLTMNGLLNLSLPVATTR